MRRAISLRARASATESGWDPANCGGRLAHRATAGESIHRITNGAAIKPARLSCEPDQDSGRDAERDAAGHPAVEPAKIEVSRQLGLRGSHPLEHPPMTHEQTEERSCDGVGHQPRLMREQGDEHRDLRRCDGEIRADRARMAALGNAEASRHDPGEQRQHRRHRNRRENEAGPDPRRKRERASIPPSMQGRRPAPTACGAGCRSFSSGRSRESRSGVGNRGCASITA